MRQISLILVTILAAINLFSQTNDIEGKPLPENILNAVIYSTELDSVLFSDIITEYYGKIIYVKFWASWCRTCIKEINYSNEIINNINNEDIIFINISTDENYKNWLKALKKYKPDGINYLIDSNSKINFKEYFQIEGVPYIFILDKNSNIAIKKAKYPSDNFAKEEILNLLNQ